MLLFGEFLRPGSASFASALAAVTVIIAGILFIIFSGETLPVVVASPGWDLLARWARGSAGQLLHSDPHLRAFDVGCHAAGGHWHVRRQLHAGGRVEIIGETRLALPLPAAACDWVALGIGNYGALKMMELIGTGKGSRSPNSASS